MTRTAGENLIDVSAVVTWGEDGLALELKTRSTEKRHSDSLCSDFVWTRWMTEKQCVFKNEGIRVE